MFMTAALKVMLGVAVTAQALSRRLAVSEVIPSGNVVINNGFRFKAVNVAAVLGN
jgi:hypothetical protein